MEDLRQIVKSDMALPFSELGKPVFYAPDASLAIDSFECQGIPGVMDFSDSMGQGRGRSSVVLVMHDALLGAGMTEPVPRGGGKKGDRVSLQNLAGGMETFVVVDADPREAGYWVLTIERLQRVNPQ